MTGYCRRGSAIIFIISFLPKCGSHFSCALLHPHVHGISCLMSSVSQGRCLKLTFPCPCSERLHTQPDSVHQTKSYLNMYWHILSSVSNQAVHMSLQVPFWPGWSQDTSTACGNGAEQWREEGWLWVMWYGWLLFLVLQTLPNLTVWPSQGSRKSKDVFLVSIISAI